MPSNSIRVLAIDPGFDRCGLAVLEKADGREKLLFSACVVTDRKSAHEERLRTIGDEIKAVVKRWKPSHLAMEKLFFNQNVNTALKVAEVRGVAMYIGSQHDIPLFEYSPQDVKIAVTGYGKAGKRQVETMTTRILGMKKAPKHDDETDAIALGITHLASYRVIC